MNISNELERELKEPVADMQSDLKNAASSSHKKRSGKLARGFRPSIKIDADGWGVIRFKTLRYAYILNQGHEMKQYAPDRRRPNGYSKRLQGSGFMNEVQDRHLPKIADTANKVSADVTVKSILK